ncbi:MAG TPA: hypothetical protein VFJ62_12220 [Usitatibacter sp.]|nr:hypothetical protein [Usitatibacter sp.]
MPHVKVCVVSAALAATLASSAGTAAGEPIAALEPMAFLAGHCWKGAFGDGGATDEHCFAWLYAGKALRDTHTVRMPGRPDYVGETTYYWDSAGKRVEFLYVENLGGISRGTVESVPGALVFPATQHVEGGKATTYRARWTIVEEGLYEAWAETPSKDGWSTLFKVKMRRVP